uniref:Uncharacterized protein n=1 Tax=Bactrocera dorsalis TaxID=27457 RepID=A0A034WSD4_BACDO
MRMRCFDFAQRLWLIRTQAASLRIPATFHVKFRYMQYFFTCLLALARLSATTATMSAKGCRNYQNDDTHDDSADQQGDSRKLSAATSIAKEDLRKLIKKKIV